MAKKRERSVITGNRWEARLSASRQLFDLIDRAWKHVTGPRTGILTLIKRDELEDLREVASMLREQIRLGNPEGRHRQVAHEGRFRAFIRHDGSAGSLDEVQNHTKILGVHEEDLAELDELIQELQQMMEPFKAPWKD